MYSVMIVDDEKAIRNNLPHALDFRGLGFQVSAVAKNGRDALDQLAQNPVDLIVLDVCMPVLDGLGMLRELSSWEEDKRPLVIMLSGYGDFEYARTAIRYGVKGYLLKPVDEDEAQPLLLELKKELDERAQRRTEAGIGEKVRLLRELYHGKDGGRERFSGDVLLHVVALAGAPGDGGIPALREAVEEQLPGGAESFFRSQGSTVTYLVSSSALEETQGSVMLYGRHISHLIRRRGGACALLFDDEVFKKPEAAFRVDCESHLYRMMSELFWGADAVLFAGTPSRHLTSLSEKQLDDDNALLQKLVRAVGEADEEGMRAAFEELTGRMQENRLHLVLLQGFCYRLYYALSEVLPRGEAVSQLRQMDLRDASCFLRWPAWKQEFWDWLKSALALSGAGKRQQAGLSEQAAEYVRAHFREPITLKSVADACFVSSAHLGRCFQRDMGVSLKQYLNDLRIEEARRLLLQTDLRVYEIAERVGFGESKHLVAKFTACCGCTPAEYRKGNIENEKKPR